MRVLALLAILAAVGLSATACGSGERGSGSTTQSTATGPPPVGNQQALARFQQCLENHGVQMPSGPPQASQQQGQPPTLDAKTQAAIQACRQYLPEDFQGQGGFGG
jgi:hypothetical protein